MDLYTTYYQNKKHTNRDGGKAYFKSPSEERAKIHVSPSFLPNLLPTGSVSMMYLIASPTRPLPPVTRITDGGAMDEVVGYWGSRLD